MSLTTFLLCLLLFVVTTLLVWWLSGTPKLVQLLLRKPPATESDSWKHDPDLAFVHAASRWRPAVAAVLASGAFALMASLLAWGLASIDIGSGLFKLEEAEAAKIGARTQDVQEWLTKDGHAAARRRFLHSFTGKKDAALEELNTSSKLAKFLVEDRTHGALVAFVDLCVKIGSSDESKDDLRKFTSRVLLPVALEVPTGDVFLTRMQSDEGLDDLREKLARVFDKKPEHKTLIVASYEKLRTAVLAHERVVTLFVGPIQMLTFAAFFLAVILLRLRERNLHEQGSYNEAWVRYAPATLESGNEVAKVALAGRVAREGDAAMREAIPMLPTTVERKELERQKVLLKTIMGYSPGKHLFAVGTANVVCSEMIDEMGIDAESGEHRGEARNLLQQVAERNENRIERVEYSAIHFLVYAIPSLGFVGTVLGIGAALGSADQVVRAADAVAQANAITAVTSILGVAFDTTLVALVCGIIVSAMLSRIRSRESAFLLDTHQKVLARMIYGGVS